MKKSLLTFSIVTTIVVLLCSKNTTGKLTGAPGAYSNDPASSNNNCTACHSGTATINNNIGNITTNIPSSGYVPGTTYTITANVTYSGKTRFGFEVTPQNSAGTQKGAIIITDAINTKIVNTKYVTHTSAGNTGSGSRSWSFNWTAPATGSGTVTFYGVLLVGNNNNSDTGDLTYKTTYSVAEAVASGVNELEANTNALTVINLSNALHISYNAQSAAPSNVELYNLNGTLVGSSSFDKQNAGKVVLNFDLNQNLSTGIYIVKVQQGTQVLTKKLPLVF